MSEYIDDKYCDNCKKETEHKIVSQGHERDSSNDTFECLVCHWWGTYLTDEYHPPLNLHDDE